jgi:hypothetical protein
MRKIYALTLLALALTAVPARADYFMSIKFVSGKLAYGILDTKELCIQEVGRHALAYGKVRSWSCKKVDRGDVIQRRIAVQLAGHDVLKA